MDAKRKNKNELIRELHAFFGTMAEEEFTEDEAAIYSLLEDHPAVLFEIHPDSDKDILDQQEALIRGDA